MASLTILSPSEQVAAHLRRELERGRWSGLMPGGPTLAEELGVDGKTVWAALGLLEEEGVLIGQGAGRPRLIVEREGVVPPTLRVAVLDYEQPEQTEQWTFSMRQLLRAEGHTVVLADKSLVELRMDVQRVAALVERTRADAWVVCSAARPVLTWFSEQETPVFALFGRRRKLPIAGVGPDHVAARSVAVRHLISLGHRRIVFLVRESQRLGGVGTVERALFEEMERHGVRTGPYNLPEWEDNAEGMHRVLDELFRVTPPTALMTDEPFLFHAVKEHLAQRGILAPRDVSLICTDPDPTFAWMRPSVAHIRWDHRPVVRRVVEWANNVARGRTDRRQRFTKADFVAGETVGPVAEQAGPGEE